MFCSRNEGRTQTTAILVRKGVPFVSLTNIADPKGKYVIVPGSLYETRLALGNVYRPNWDNPFFFFKLITLLEDPNDYQLLGGDFNCVSDPYLDPSNPRPNYRISKAGILSFTVWHLMPCWILGENQSTARCYSGTGFLQKETNLCHFCMEE